LQVSPMVSDLRGTHFQDSQGFLSGAEGLGVRHSLLGLKIEFASSSLRGAELFGSGRNRRSREGLRFFCFQASASFLPPAFGVITMRPSWCTTMRSIRC
jgi:hypothetical protein